MSVNTNSYPESEKLRDSADESEVIPFEIGDDGLVISEGPKNPRASLRQKYNRRLEMMVHVVEQYLFFAKQRLDPNVAGETYRREETEAIVEHAQKLLDIIPARLKPTFDNVESAGDELLEVFAKLSQSARDGEGESDD